MPLLIQLTKRRDGSTVLHCIRADGTVTWQKREPRHGEFFARHDLTHFAVESELGFRQGFFGLIADNWEIGDTTGKGAPGGPCPKRSTSSERLNTERASGALWSATEFNEHAALRAQATDCRGSRACPRRRADLFIQWQTVAADGTLELQFESLTGQRAGPK